MFLVLLDSHNKKTPWVGWWENLEVLEDSSKLVLEAFHKLLEALKEETTLDTGKALTGLIGITINAPRYACSRLPQS